MPSFQKTCLNINTWVFVNIWKPKAGSKCKKRNKEGNVNFKTFHVFSLFFLNWVPKTFVDLLKPLAKRSILERIIIYFKKCPIARKISRCYTSIRAPMPNELGRRIKNGFRDRCPVPIFLWIVMGLCPKVIVREGFSVTRGLRNRGILS